MVQGVVRSQNRHQGFGFASIVKGISKSDKGSPLSSRRGFSHVSLWRFRSPILLTKSAIDVCSPRGMGPLNRWLSEARQWIHPFAASGEGEIIAMADVLTHTLKGLSALLGNPPYNLWIHTSPCDGGDYGYYHWHVELVPRIIVSAGFELATGMFISILAPEEAARQLREKSDQSTD